MDKKNREFRNVPFEVRSAEDNNITLEGYAIVFDTESVDLGGYTERIAPTAITNESIAQQRFDVFAFLNHDEHKVLGRTKSKTLELSVDTRGVYFKLHLGNTEAARDCRNYIERGEISNMSFSFTCKDYSFDEVVGDDGNKRYVKNVLSMILYEVSPVFLPAYEVSSCEASKRDFENYKNELQNNFLKDYKSKMLEKMY